MKNYFAPEVEILDVMVEQGFAASNVEIEGGGLFGTDEDEF